MADSYITIDPAMRSGEPTLNHTRLQAEVIAGYVWSGDEVDFIADEYEITRADVLVCCWYEGSHGTRTWRKRWGQWAKQVHGELWHGRYEVPDPPTREDS